MIKTLFKKNQKVLYIHHTGRIENGKIGSTIPASPTQIKINGYGVISLDKVFIKEDRFSALNRQTAEIENHILQAEAQLKSLKTKLRDNNDALEMYKVPVIGHAHPVWKIICTFGVTLLVVGERLIGQLTLRRQFAPEKTNTKQTGCRSQRRDVART